MKTLSTTLATLVLLLLLSISSCKEIGPQIGGPTAAALLDTTYVTATPAKQDRVVLIEEYTGAKCVNCPKGHEVVASLLASNPGRVAAIAYHKFGSTLDQPAHLGQPGFDSVKEDYRRQEANDIMNAIFGIVSNIPQAGIDRFFSGSDKFYSRPSWAGITTSRLAIPSKLNLEASMVMAADQKSGILTIKGVYTSAVTEKQVLNILLTENDLESAQYYPDSVQQVYIHEHVFRKAYTPASGRPILQNVADIEPGRAFELAFKLDFQPLWNINKCELVIFVSNNGQENKELGQSLKMKVIP